MKAKAPSGPSGASLTFIKNCSREGPGALEIFAQERGVPYELRDLEAGEALPDPAACRAVVILGGPASANDQSPTMLAELDFARALLAAGVPTLGVCLGLQVLCKAAGGTVNVHSIREMGVVAPDRRPYAMALTEAGRADPLFKAIDNAFPPVKPGATIVLPVFQLHGETVVLPEGGPIESRLLATGIFCTNQAARFGAAAWGVQGHVEITRDMAEAWMHDDENLRDIDRIGLLRDLSYVIGDYERAARIVFANFLEIAGL